MELQRERECERRQRVWNALLGCTVEGQGSEGSPQEGFFSPFLKKITSPTHTNATPPSCAKYHDAKPEVLGAQVPLSSAWCLVTLLLPSILFYAKRFLAF